MQKREEKYLGVASLESLCSLSFVVSIIRPGKIDLLSLKVTSLIMTWVVSPGKTLESLPRIIILSMHPE